MVLRAVPRYVRDVLKITGLDLVISIEDSNAAPGG
jgi:anti-anti-sigma regulatory factor